MVVLNEICGSPSTLACTKVSRYENRRRFTNTHGITFRALSSAAGPAESNAPFNSRMAVIPGCLTCFKNFAESKNLANATSIGAKSDPLLLKWDAVIDSPMITEYVPSPKITGGGGKIHMSRYPSQKMKKFKRAESRVNFLIILLLSV